jgi:hypothetical protein
MLKSFLSLKQKNELLKHGACNLYDECSPYSNAKLILSYPPGARSAACLANRASNAILEIWTGHLLLGGSISFVGLGRCTTLFSTRKHITCWFSQAHWTIDQLVSVICFCNGQNRSSSKKESVAKFRTELRSQISRKNSIFITQSLKYIHLLIFFFIFSCTSEINGWNGVTKLHMLELQFTCSSTLEE